MSHHDHDTTQTIHPLGLLAMLTTLFAWTAAPLLMEHFSTAMDVWTMNGWRYGAAALCWSPLIALRLATRRFPGALWRAALVPTIFNCMGQVALASAFYYTDPTMVAFSLRVQLIAVALGGAICFAAERRVIREPKFLIGMVLVLAGVGAYLLLHPDFAVAGTDTLIGAALGATAGATFGGYALSIRPLMRAHPPILSYAVISAYTAAAMLALMFLFADIDHGFPGGVALRLSPAQFALLIASALIALFVGHPCYYYAIRAIGVSATAAVLQLQPITVGIGALLFFEGAVNLGQSIAGTVAVASAIWMLRIQHRVAQSQRTITPAPHATPVEAKPREPGPEPAYADTADVR
ncbi:MAG: hypothetical protein Tsb0013_01720 [Phycisphaerales bacterium]